MELKKFKEKYFTNNFYWINKDNYKKIQLIGIELGCVNPNKNKTPINWHDGFKCLGFRTYEKNDNITVFQKEPFLMHNENATSFDEMIKEYKLIK